MTTGRLSGAMLFLTLAPVFLPPALSAEERGKAPPPPASPAERVAGRWRIVVEGMAAEHEEILASFAVDGGLLIGTLSVGRETVKIASGAIVGSEISFAFGHPAGSTIKMMGAATPRGLEGTWEAGGEKGKWRARRAAS